jgi:hypothetical protein
MSSVRKHFRMSPLNTKPLTFNFLDNLCLLIKKSHIAVSKIRDLFSDDILICFIVVIVICIPHFTSRAYHLLGYFFSSNNYGRKPMLTKLFLACFLFLAMVLPHEQHSDILASCI